MHVDLSPNASQDSRSQEFEPAIAALRESEQELADFFENSAVCLHWIGADGTILRANRAELELLGYTHDEYVGRNIAEFHADRVVIDDILARLTRGETLRGCPARLRCKDGATRDVLIDSNVRWGKNREFVHTRCFTRDVTEQKRAEEAVRANAQRLDGILRQATVGVAQTDITGRFVLVNERYCKMAGRSREELMHLRMQDITHPDDLPGNAILFRRAAETGEDFVIEKRYVRPDDSLVWVSNSVYAVRDKNGAPEYMVAVSADITDRKRAEAQLRESERRLRELIEALPAAVYTTDAEGRITSFNEAAVRFSGRVPELGTDSWCVSWKLFYPDGTPMPHDQCPMAMALEQGQPVLGHEAIAERPDGTRVHFVPYPTPLRDASGEVIGAVNMLVDITERKQAEAALRQSEERLRAMFDAANDALLILDDRFNVISANGLTERLYGYSSAELRAKNLRDLRAPQARPSVEADMQRSILQGGARWETLHLRKDGRVFDVEVTSKPFRLGEQVRFVHIVRDITERKQAEALLASQKQAFEMAASGAPLMQVLDFLASALESQSQHRAIVAIHLLDESGTRFKQTAAPGLPAAYRQAVDGMEVSSAAGPCCAAISTRQRITVPDVAASDQFPAFASFALPLGIRAGWSTPIFSSTGAVLGTVANYYREAREPHPQDDLLGEIVTRTAAVIIERKQADQAVRQRTAQFETLLNKAPLGVYLVDADFRVQAVNPVALPVFGDIPGGVVGRDFDEIIHILWQKEYADEIVRIFRHTLETGEPYIAPERAELRIDRGITEYYEWRLDRIMLPDGRYGLVCYFKDISAQVLARIAIAESAERYRSLVSVVTDVPWTTDAEGQFISLQPAWADYTGQTWEEMRGFGWLHALHPDDRERNNALWLQARRSRGTYKSDGRLWHAHTKQWRHFVARATPLLAPDGSVREWVGAYADVHEQKLAEEALREADRRKDEFIAMLAHELRNPLSAIGMSAELLGRTRIDDKKARFAVPAIARQTKQLQRLADDLLDMARVTFGKLALHKQPLDLLEAAKSVAADYASRAQLSAAIEVAGAETWVEADPARVQQMIENLVGNAIKYGGKKITMRVGGEGQWGRLSIQDDGQGIAPELLPELFTPFVQGRQSLEREQGGLGLGLALVDRLASLQGGGVRAHSDGPGKGSTFTLSLPVTDKPAARAAASPSALKLARRRVLVVEDEEDSRDCLRLLLETDGHEVSVAGNGADGLAILATFRPDIALVDVGLPGLDGYEIARRARSLPDGKRIKLVAITGYGGEKSRRKARNAGFDLQLTKPVTYEELIRVFKA